MKSLMKSFICFILFSLFSIAATAQESYSKSASGKQLFIGLGLSTTSFQLNFYKNFDADLQQSGTITPVPYLHIGYQLNERAKMQIGVAYGKKNQHSFATSYLGGGKTKEFHNEYRSQGVAIPVTIQFILFDTNKRFPFYTTGSIIPVYGSTRLRGSIVENKITTTPYDYEAKGFNIFGTGGFGFQYNVSKRFNGFAEILLLKGNLAGGGQSPFRRNRIKYMRFYNAFGIGLNYNLSR